MAGTLSDEEARHVTVAETTTAQDATFAVQHFACDAVCGAESGQKICVAGWMLYHLELEHTFGVRLQQDILRTSGKVAPGYDF